MEEKEKIGDLINEKLSRLSSDFELDLNRLLKTVSLYTQSKEILQKNFAHLDLESTNFQKNLGNFTISLLELEKKISEKFIAHVEITPESLQDLNRYINDLKLLINEYINYTKELNHLSEKTSSEDIDNLEAIKNLYDLELRSAQKELDSRLERLAISISKTISEARDSDSKTIKLPSSSTSPTQENRTSAAAPTSSKRVALKDPKIIIFSAVSMFLGCIIGIALFYLFTHIGLSNKEDSSEIPNISSMSSAKETNIDKETTKKKKDETQEVSAKAKINPSYANVRSGPGIRYPVLFAVNKGEIVLKGDEQKGNWIKIINQEGQEGWISGELIRDLNDN